MIDKIKIGPLSYCVRVMEDLHTTNDDGKKIDLHGHILWSEQEIRVNKASQMDRQIVTMWHEALHGILEMAGHNDHPEVLIQALAFGLVQLVKDNPQLIELTVKGELKDTP